MGQRHSEPPSDRARVCACDSIVVSAIVISLAPIAAALGSETHETHTLPGTNVSLVSLFLSQPHARARVHAHGTGVGNDSRDSYTHRPILPGPAFLADSPDLQALEYLIAAVSERRAKPNADGLFSARAH